MICRRHALATSLLLAIFSPALAAPPDYSTLTRSVDAAVASDGLPSAVVVLFDRQRILYSHVAGYADVEHKRPPTLNTRYRVGSMAKAVTSTVLAIAQQKGLISLNATIPVKTADGTSAVPVRELLNMQAGLAQAVCYQGIAGDSDPDCTGAFDDRFAASITDGRGRYSYSNMGPQRAADRLSRRLQRGFGAIAQRLLFSPAGMAEATYDHDAPAGETASSYYPNGKPYQYDFIILPAAGAGLEVSALDAVRFGQLHLTGRAPDGTRLLSDRTLALLHSAPNGAFYGFGWGRIGAGKPTELLIADGQVNGGQAMLLLNPVRGVGAVVLCNAAHEQVSELALTAIDAVMPGTSAAFGADVERAQSAHASAIKQFLPPAEFRASGFIREEKMKIPLDISVRENRLTESVRDKADTQAQWEEDEGFRGWTVPCPSEISACRRPGASAKLWLSRDRGGLGGQLQVTSFNGQLPFAVRLRFH